MRLQPLQSPAATVTDDEIDQVIARTLAESRQLDARAAMPDIVSQDELLGRAGRNARQDAAEGGAAAARMDAVAAEYAPAKPAAQAADQVRRRAPKLRRLGKWPRRAALAGIALAAFWLAPWGAALITLVALVLAAALVLAMGSDRVADTLALIHNVLHARNPDRAERFRLRVDRLATIMDGVLDRLPERWTAGLYIRDFSRHALLGEDMTQRPDPFDRLAAAARNG
ncbi:hypothetical protein DC366_03880 [Pelagivirga sediminicola]|uniref:Uncharacterized protein n=2 Tax=Pelagivirga sediminicola TaxID=2170575 RepID=A0A2T7G944_9RHOB|nr:hypothetical protein DC366_03880 [Pelagivirga sediminicola]